MGVLIKIENADFSANAVAKFDSDFECVRKKTGGLFERNLITTQFQVGTLLVDNYRPSWNGTNINIKIGIKKDSWDSEGGSYKNICSIVQKQIEFSIRLVDGVLCAFVMKEDGKSWDLYRSDITLSAKVEYIIEADFKDLSLVGLYVNSTKIPTTKSSGAYSSAAPDSYVLFIKGVNESPHYASGLSMFGLMVRSGGSIISLFDVLGDTFNEKITDKITNRTLVDSSGTPKIESSPIS